MSSSHSAPPPRQETGAAETILGRDHDEDEHITCGWCVVDAVIDAGTWARFGDVAVLSDTVIIEGMANGLTVIETVQLIRPDGRSAYLYLWPADGRT